MYLLMILSSVAQVLCLLLFLFCFRNSPYYFWSVCLFVFLASVRDFLLFDTLVRIFRLFSFEEKFSTQGWSKIVKIAVLLI